MIAAARSSSRLRTAGRFSRTSGLSMAELRMSPASPPVQHTRTVWTPSAWYLAIEPAPLDDSSSGWACTVRMHRGSRMRSRYPPCWDKTGGGATSSPYFFLAVVAFFTGAGGAFGPTLVVVALGAAALGAGF